MSELEYPENTPQWVIDLADDLMTKKSRAAESPAQSAYEDAAHMVLDYHNEGEHRFPECENNE